jgi:hypothetical protein
MQWSVEHTEYTTASPASIWALWSDVEGWPAWDSGLAGASLEGPFAAGSRGRVKPAGGPKVGFELTSVEPESGFADVTRLPLARMSFEHAAVREGDRTRLTHRATISGLATPLFARLIGRGIARDLPDTMRELARMAADRDAADRAAG